MNFFLFSLSAGSCYVGVSKRFSRSISLAVYFLYTWIYPPQKDMSYAKNISYFAILARLEKCKMLAKRNLFLGTCQPVGKNRWLKDCAKYGLLHNLMTSHKKITKVTCSNILRTYAAEIEEDNLHWKSLVCFIRWILGSKWSGASRKNIP